MQNNFQPYSNSVNSKIIHTIGKQIVLDVAPDEELSAGKLIDPILQKYEQGEFIKADASSNDAGGFGSVDLVTLVVIPLLVTTLGEICKQLVVLSVEGIKEWANNDKDKKKRLSQMIDIIIEEKYEEVSKKANSKKSKSKGKAIRNALKVRVKNHFELD